MTQGDVPEPVVEDQASENVPILGVDAVPETQEAVEGHSTGSRFQWPVTALRRMTTRHLAADPVEAVTPPPPPIPSETTTDTTIRQPFAFGFYATIGALVALGLAMALIPEGDPPHRRAESVHRPWPRPLARDEYPAVELRLRKVR